MRVRGLKQDGMIESQAIAYVAPHAGAWIETCDLLKFVRLDVVAPHAGAWIETPLPMSLMVLVLSHPMRVRGLKQNR